VLSIQRVAELSSSLEDCGWPRVGFEEDYDELKTPINGDVGVGLCDDVEEWVWWWSSM